MNKPSSMNRPTPLLDSLLRTIRAHDGFQDLLKAMPPPTVPRFRKSKAEQVEAERSKAYSDSMSDLPMLEAVGRPVATNPGRRLRQIAERRGWEVLRLQ